jgi:MPBQ/MSBQ methyltransferase
MLPVKQSGPGAHSPPEVMVMTSDPRVATHYSVGDLEQKFLDAASAAGLDVTRLGPGDLAAADEFHIGGRQATAHLLDQLDLRAGMHVLDLGSGPGGASRFAAAQYGCQVTGVDITREYVDLAAALAWRMGLADRVDYRLADVVDLPFEAGSFDGAFMLHVGMNVADKPRLCAEVARVLASGASFALYDVMRIGPGEVEFPVPWAGSAAISFVEPPEHYRACLEAAGFQVVSTQERTEFALDFYREMRARMSAAGTPPLGLHLVMGADSAQKVANMIQNIERGVVAPVEMIARLDR